MTDTETPPDVLAHEAIPAFKSGGQSMLPFVATAYTAGPESTGKAPGHPAYGITRSGRKAEEGRTVAVDPAVIPLDTWVYIENVGLRRAEDTGGKIKGCRLDIFMQSLPQALDFGVQTVNIQVLADIA